MEAFLVFPSGEYLLSYLSACREGQAENMRNNIFHDPDEFETWQHDIFRYFEDSRRGVNLKEGYVPASNFWLIDKGEVVGAGNVRHRLTPALERYGGHIGYGIRASKRGRGYGELLLGLLLKEAYALGISRVLLTCDEDNLASARVMEKNGAILSDVVTNSVDGKEFRTKRYFIDL